MKPWLALFAVAPWLLVQNEPKPVQVDIVWSTDCPVAQRWVTKVAAWTVANPSIRPTIWFPNDDRASAEAYAARFRLRGDIRALQGSELAYEFGLDRLPSVIVRSGGKVAFVGGVGLTADSSSRFMLSEAVAATRRGVAIVPSRTTPLGCTVPDLMKARPGSPVEFKRDIKPMLDRFCVSCHSPGGAAPFRLDRYENARRWSHMISDVLRTGKMPPVKVYDRTGPSRPVAPNSAAIEKLVTWREYGCPEGGDTNPAVRAEFAGVTLGALARPRMGETRFVDVPVPSNLTSIKSYDLEVAGVGEVRGSWLFASAAAPGGAVDGGRTWKALPRDSRLIFASQVGAKHPADQIALRKSERLFLRMQLYGTDEVGPVRPRIRLRKGDGKSAETSVIRIAPGRYPSFDGTVDLFESVRFLRRVSITAVTPITDPVAPEISIQSPQATFLVAAAHQPVQTIVLQNPISLDSLIFVARYGGPSMSGESSLRAVVVGNHWNGTTAELWIRYQLL